MKSFHIVTTMHLGGSQVFLSQLACAMARDSTDVWVFSLFKEDGHLTQTLRNRGVRVITLAGSRMADARQPAIRLAGVVLAVVHLALSMIRRRPDIVHTLLPLATIVAIPVAWALRIRTRIANRRSLNNYQQGHPWARLAERFALARSTHIIGNSTAVLSQLRDEEGVEEGKLTLLYNGVDLDHFSFSQEKREQAREELGIPIGAQVLVVAANLIPYKGHDDLLVALSGVDAQITLLCCGRDDGIGQSLRRLGDALMIDVRWLGARQDVNAILSASDIAILPSHQEGFSNSILEAMAASRPVIATNVGGNGDSVIDGQTGYLVKARDEDSMRLALQKLIRSGDLRDRMGYNGRKRVEELFSLGVALDRYIEFFKSAVSNTMAAPDNPRVS